jgi:hypothetical protein
VVDRASARLEGGEFYRLFLGVHGRLSVLGRIWVVWVLVLEGREGEDGAGGRVSDDI